MKNTQHILIIGYVWPEPNSSAAGRRMIQLLDLFQSQGWTVTFASASTKTKFSVDLEEQGITTEKIQLNSSTFDEFVSKLNPDIVLFDRFVVEEQFGWRVAENCPDAVRILDTEDLHCLRDARRTSLKAGNEFKTTDLLSTEMAKREVASILRCDLSLIISEYEIRLLKDVFCIDQRLLFYIPFFVKPIGHLQPSEWPLYEERRHFITVGNFRHPPNWDAVLYLKQVIWPLIRNKQPEAQLHIYGAYPSQKVNQLNNPGEGFYIEGRAKDAREVVKKSRICLAPLRFGAGLKGKLVEAMQCGTPNITTDVGAEGLPGEFVWSGEIKNSPDEIADSAVALYSNIKAWKRAQQNGINIINNRFNKQPFESSFMNRISEIQSRLKQHRTKNFMGQMLMNDTLNSAKYMSRWIEEKNK